MEISVAKFAGFCFGVKRAIKIAQESIEKCSRVVTLGPIIHNPQMVELMKEKGLGYVNSIDDINNQAVIIRSHGITAQNKKKLQEKRINIIDATCPFVKKAQEYAEKLTKEGYQLVILGEKNHPEVEAICSYIDDSSIVVANPYDSFKIYKKKVGLIAQTTQREEKFEALAIRLMRECRDLRIVKTICDATIHRQDSTRDLAKKVDTMLVIGGKNSANTTRLAEISQEEGCKTYHIETEKELQNKWFKNIHHIGITAGASTPRLIIIAVKEKIRSKYNK